MELHQWQHTNNMSSSHDIVMATSSSSSARVPQVYLDILWRVSCVWNTLGAISVTLVIREYRVNRALWRPALRPLMGQVIANTIWIIAYLPFNYNNAIQGQLTTGVWCSFVCYFIAMSYMLSAASGALLAIATYDVIAAGLRWRPIWCTPASMVAVWITAMICGVVWAATMHHMNHIGTAHRYITPSLDTMGRHWLTLCRMLYHMCYRIYSGMFCFIANQGHIDTGGVYFTFVSLAACIIIIFGYKTYRLVKHESVYPIGVTTACMRIFRRTLILLGIYAGTYSGNIMYIFHRRPLMTL